MTMPIPDGSVVITPRQMYDQIGTLTDEVRSLKAAVDPALSDARSDVHAAQQAIAQHELDGNRLATRVTIIETKLKVIWGAIGFAFVALGGVGAVAMVVANR